LQTQLQLYPAIKAMVSSSNNDLHRKRAVEKSTALSFLQWM